MSDKERFSLLISVMATAFAQACFVFVRSQVAALYASVCFSLLALLFIAAAFVIFAQQH